MRRRYIGLEVTWLKYGVEKKIKRTFITLSLHLKKRLENHIVFFVFFAQIFQKKKKLLMIILFSFAVKDGAFRKYSYTLIPHLVVLQPELKFD